MLEMVIFNKIIASIITIMPALAIFGKIKELLEISDRLSITRRSRIKKALDNPFLTNRQKISYGMELIRLDFKSIYKFNPKVPVIQKIVKIEQVSNSAVTIDDFALANFYIDFANNKITIKDKTKWFDWKRRLNFWGAFVVLIISIFGFIYYLVILSSPFMLANFHFGKPIGLDDFIFMVYIALYLFVFLLMRDEAKALRALENIISFAKGTSGHIDLKRTWLS